MKAIVLRAGSWGSTLAGVLAKNGHMVTLVAPNPKLRKELADHRENRLALPGVIIPDNVKIVADARGAIDEAQIVLFPGPCDRMREMAAMAIDSMSSKALAWSDRVVVTAAKGIETDTLECMSEVLASSIGIPGDSVVALSGPSFARFVGLEQPTTVVAASNDEAKAKVVQGAFMNSSFRVYRSSDILGVELGGALKNVIALAAGMLDGLELGDNSRAALMTRGLAEIARLGIAMGARHQTFAGLSGMGDLVLTCSGRESRNHHVGEQIGRGRSIDDVLAEMVTVAEGVQTTRAVVELGRRHGVEMPIAEHVHDVLFSGRTPEDAVKSLMLRDPKPEHWS
jgi:glycerol-3-phosphate dehydrogenase (NAD(P)+)